MKKKVSTNKPTLSFNMVKRHYAVITFRNKLRKYSKGQLSDDIVYSLAR